MENDWPSAGRILLAVLGLALFVREVITAVKKSRTRDVEVGLQTPIRRHAELVRRLELVRILSLPAAIGCALLVVVTVALGGPIWLVVSLMALGGACVISGTVLAFIIGLLEGSR